MANTLGEPALGGLARSERSHQLVDAKQVVSVCVFDLDNTLFDWVGIWHAAFSAMLTELSARSGLSVEVLVPEFRAIHQRHGTTEYAFAITELPSLMAQHPGEDLWQLYDEAMHAYYRARKQALTLYPGVFATLTTLREQGCVLAAYTESMAFYSAYRVRQLGLDELLDFMYSPEDHVLPRNMRAEEIRKYPPEHYRLRRTVQRHTPRGELKPNPGILRSIIAELGADTSGVAYIGDSKMKDISMANVAGVTSVWAAYGAAQHRPEYALLRAVTHWTDEDVERERRIADGLSSDDLTPNHVLQHGLAEMLDCFTFRPALR